MTTTLCWVPVELICIQQNHSDDRGFNFRMREMHTTLPQTMIYHDRKFKQEKNLALGFQSPSENGKWNLNTLRFVSVMDYTPTAHHLTKWARIPRLKWLKNKFKSFWCHSMLKKTCPKIIRRKEPIPKDLHLNYSNYSPKDPWDWYIYLHEWLILYGKCREIYQSHGWYG